VSSSSRRSFTSRTVAFATSGVISELRSWRSMSRICWVTGRAQQLRDDCRDVVHRVLAVELIDGELAQYVRSGVLALASQMVHDLRNALTSAQSLKDLALDVIDEVLADKPVLHVVGKVQGETQRLEPGSRQRFAHPGLRCPLGDGRPSLGIADQFTDPWTKRRQVESQSVSDFQQILITHEIARVFGQDSQRRFGVARTTFGGRQVRGVEHPVESKLQEGYRRGNRVDERRGVALSEFRRI